MKNEHETPFTPEQHEALEGERTKSDAELIKGGGKWKLNEEGEKTNLEVTQEQAHEINMEHEGGIVDNLGTYIRLNKSILLPASEMRDDLREALRLDKGWIWPNLGGYEYVDKDGNLATFKIDAESIKSLSKEGRTTKERVIHLDTAVAKELKALGFQVIDKPKGRLGEMIEDGVRYKIGQTQVEQSVAKNKAFNF